jgi:probable HAF family extracellular repeat protein
MRTQLPTPVQAFTHPRLLARLAAAASLAAVAGCTDSPPLTTATAPVAAASRGVTPAYAIRDLQGDLGAAGFVGVFGVFDVNNAGDVAGSAVTTAGGQHAFRWSQGQALDIGTLGGFDPMLNSQAAGRTGGRVLSILSDITTLDPLQEDFCGLGSTFICRAALWRDGVMLPLPTLGGNNAAALTMNATGQLVGLAEDGVLDNSCIAPQQSHFQAASWENGAIRKLDPLPGDEVAMALRNNDNDQIVGTSGLCSNTFYGGFGIGAHAVLWDHGSPVALGSLGGAGGSLAAGINNRGDVIGASSAADGTLHPFLWTKASGMRDLGLLSADPADAANTPFQVNNRGQMVGSSCDATLTFCRGYLWQDGAFQDINDLIPASANLYVIVPLAINDAGQIAGLALDLTTFDLRAFVATPSGNVVGGAHRAPAAGSVPLPATARARLRRQLGRRSSVGITRPVAPSAP